MNYGQGRNHKMIKNNFNMLVQKASATHFTYFHFKLTKANQNIIYLFILVGGRKTKTPLQRPVVLAYVEEK